MKFGNTNPVKSTVGSNGRGFRAVRKRSDGDSGSSEKNLVSATAVNPSAPAIGLSVSDINWRLVRTDDRIFLLLASFGIGDLDAAKMERIDLLHHALNVFKAKSIRYILSVLLECYSDVPVGETDTLEKVELVPIVVNILMFAAIAKRERFTAPTYTVNCEHYW